MSHYQAVLFDFDYTLADASAGIADCVNTALVGLGRPAVPAELIYRTIGRPLPEAFAQFAGPAHPASFDDFYRLFLARADEVMVGLTVLLPPAPPVLRQLKAAGLALGIVSMKSRPHIEPVLHTAGLLPLIETIVGGDDVTHGKPDPEGLRLALARLGRVPSEALYVGDSPADAETARRAGVDFAAVLSGHTARPEFAGYPVAAIFDTLADLPGWLGRS